MFKKKPRHDPATQLDAADPFSVGAVTSQLISAYMALSQPTTATWPISLPSPPEVLRNVPSDIEADLKALGVGESIAFPRSLVPGSPHFPLVVYPFSLDDSSEYVWEVESGLATKVKDGVTIVSPDEVEETDELITGWRVFTVENYKLKGSWLPWDGPENTALCSCDTFRYYLRVFTPPDAADQDNLRQRAREHLASGAGTCGIYSRTGLQGAGIDLRGQMHWLQVAASVVNYGLVYKYSDGYRAEKSRISKLWVLARDSDEIFSLDEDLAPALYASLPGAELSRSPYPVRTNPARTPVSRSTLVQLLNTTYGVPVEAMSPLEFLWRQEAGAL